MWCHYDKRIESRGQKIKEIFEADDSSRSLMSLNMKIKASPWMLRRDLETGRLLEI
jgi:hypothetical protein